MRAAKEMTRETITEAVSEIAARAPVSNLIVLALVGLIGGLMWLVKLELDAKTYLINTVMAEVVANMPDKADIAGREEHFSELNQQIEAIAKLSKQTKELAEMQQEVLLKIESLEQKMTGKTGR